MAAHLRRARIGLAARSICAGSVAYLLLGLAPAHGQQNPSTNTCLDLRAVDTRPLVDAAESKRSEAIAQALLDVSKLPRFAVPVDPVSGRRPVLASYKILLSDAQLERRARIYVETVAAQADWRRAGTEGRRLRRLDLSKLAGQVRSLLMIADAFPDQQKAARGLARDMGDAILAATKVAGVPTAPLAPAVRAPRVNPFMRTTLRRALRTCVALRETLASGWLVSERVPEIHYRATGLVGEAMITLTRATGERRFLAWAQAASDWMARHPLVADVHANALAAGLDADLYTFSANTLYLERARERVALGVLPAFRVTRDATQPLPFVLRLPLRDLAEITRALAHVAIAIAAAPANVIAPGTLAQVEAATNFGYANLQKRAGKDRRLQFPAQQIELAFDVERAQRAGAKLNGRDREAFRHVLAHGADRVQRYIPLSGGASGLLLAGLKARNWGGAYRISKPSPATPEAE